MSRPLGCKQTPEAREKISRTLRKRWQDPEFRARHLPHLMEVRPLGVEASSASRRIRPPKGTPERRQYEKVRSILGPEAARTILGGQP